VAKLYCRWPCGIAIIPQGWLENDRFDHQAQTSLWTDKGPFPSVKGKYVLVALDFSNLRKPYGYRFEGLCTLKATGRTGPRLRKGLVPGYNHQLVVLAIAKEKVGLTYARTISYAYFLSLNGEVFKAIRYSKTILRGHKLRFVCDSQFDDGKTSHYIVHLDEEFIIRHDRALLLPFSRKKREVLPEDFVPLVRLPIRFEAWFRVGSLAKVPGGFRLSRGMAAGPPKALLAPGLPCPRPIPDLDLAHQCPFPQPAYSPTDMARLPSSLGDRGGVALPQGGRLTHRGLQSPFPGGYPPHGLHHPSCGPPHLEWAPLLPRQGLAGSASLRRQVGD